MSAKSKSKGKEVILGVTGSIAAYKAPDLASKLVKLQHNVRVVLTREAKQFITPLTMQTMSRNPVHASFEDELDQWHPGHLELADNADLILLAPATAHVIAEIALGLAGDLLTTVCLATQAPILVAPAMNGKMWLHEATQANVATLKQRGVHFIGPDEGLLACGYEGIGRLWPVDGIVEAARKILDSARSRRK
ncbi:MAG: phosphopantothenoylcysteine decarboxylase [Verrucomicrobiae bacterium]|nr:phosphopantothenoylcysteine decarboxylase [Verrucomicrobiae bacterium]